MRKLIAAEFMTIDGVIQTEENDGDGFKYTGWFFGYADDVTGAVIQERLNKPVDLLLGRKTFDIWEPYWPTHSDFWPNVMTATKYVASNTVDSSDWQPTFRSQLRTKRKLTDIGTPSWATAAKRVNAAGAKTNGASPGRSRPSPSPKV